MSWLLDRIIPDKQNAEEGGRILTKQQFQDQIVRHFTFRLKEESTTEGVLFPTSFMVFLSPEDYNVRKETFASTVQQLVNKSFRRILDTALKADPDYTPHSEYWQFQFLVFPDNGFLVDRGQKYTGLEPGKVLIQSTIYPLKDFSERGSMNDDGAPRVVTTIHTKDSLSMNDLAINFDSLKGVEALAADKFRVPYGKKLTEEPKSLKEMASPENSAKCSLHIISGSTFSTGRTTFHMTTDNLYISGPSGEDNIGGIPVAHLNDKSVVARHVLIKKQGDSYNLFARGEVLVEEVEVKPDGNAAIPLADGNQILINGEIAIEFKIL